MSAEEPQLPAGTQVVLRAALAVTVWPEDWPGAQEAAQAQRGATGRVIGTAGDGRYVVRLADGRETLAQRSELALRAAHAEQLVAAADHDGPALVRQHTIYAVVVGSRAFGLHTDGSDTDTRGVYVAPTPAFWSLAKPPTHVDLPADEAFYWEVERFCELALKANPNLLEVLHSPLVVASTELGDELQQLRPAFLSQLAYQTYSGYVLSQFKKLEADLRRDGTPRWKHVMHLLRLLLAARTLLTEGRIVVDVGEHRDRLLAVRRGELPWDEVERWRLRLHAELDTALEHTPLPAGPDVAKVDGWLHSVRARMVR